MNETLQLQQLRVCEIFKSIQGESTYAGRICTFVRLTGCNLSCRYCDTAYARDGGTVMSIGSIIAAVNEYSCDLVEITGGEPLLQPATAELARMLLANGKTLLIETNGSLDISVLPAGCIRIVDVKCPSSGMAESFFTGNIGHLCRNDEVKFVIGSHDDFLWALSFVYKSGLSEKATVLFSPVAGLIAPADLAAWILENNSPVRFQLQLHKILWGEKQGV